MTIKRAHWAWGTLLVVAAGLAGCGGGGGGSTTAATSSPSTPSTPASSPSTTPTAPTGPAPTTTIAAASYAASSVEAGVYNGINQIRQAGKWGTLTQDALLDKAGRNMADYTIANYVRADGTFDPAMYNTDAATGWLMGHVQTVGKPLFTGVLPADRFKAAGQSDFQVALENGGFYFSNFSTAAAIDWCVDGWMRSTGHRQAALHPQANFIGVGVSVNQVKVPSGDTASTCYLELTLPKTSLVYDSAWSAVFPVDGSTVNYVSDFYGKGLALSISFDKSVVSVTSFVLTNRATGAAVVGSPSYYGVDRTVYTNIAFFQPTAPLPENTTFNASAIVVVQDSTGKQSTVEKKWSFSTGTDKYKNVVTTKGAAIPPVRAVSR